MAVEPWQSLMDNMESDSGFGNQTTPGTNPFSIPDWGHLAKVLSLLVLEARVVNLTLKQPQSVVRWLKEPREH